ncbi:MAG: sugar phosphate isomerase/epimerase family protein [Desulfurococcaceae archaeon]
MSPQYLFYYNMVWYGVQAWLWTTKFVEKDLPIFDKLQEIGYDGLEIDLGHPESLPIDGIKYKMRETGVKCTFSVGLSKETDVSSSDPETRKRGIAYIKKLVDIASELESDVICGILYAAWGEVDPKGRRPEKYEWAMECLREAADYASQHGVTLALEPVNRFEGYLICTAEEMLDFVKRINHPNVKVHLDTFQMNIEEDNLYKAIKRAGEYLYHVHLCENHRGIPGTGHIPWMDIFKALKEIGYNRWVVVEAWVHDVFLTELGEIPPKIAMWRRLAPSGDIVAEQALKFLKEIEKKVA